MRPLAQATRLIREINNVRACAGLTTAARFGSSIVRVLPSVLSGGTLEPADRAMPATDYKFTIFGKDIILPHSSFSGAREMYGRRVYFPIPEMRLRPCDWIVDLGANEGLFSVLAAQFANRVLGVEAQAGFRPNLERNAKRNRCLERIVIENALIGARVGKLSSAVALRQASHYEGPVTTVTMQELIDRHAISRIDFLKMDIEGSEFEVLTTATQWLSRVNRIALEAHAEYGDPAGVAGVLRDFGFQTSLRSATGQAVGADYRQDCYIYGWRN